MKKRGHRLSPKLEGKYLSTGTFPLLTPNFIVKYIWEVTWGKTGILSHDSDCSEQSKKPVLCMVFLFFCFSYIFPFSITHPRPWLHHCWYKAHPATVHENVVSKSRVCPQTQPSSALPCVSSPWNCSHCPALKTTAIFYGSIKMLSPSLVHIKPSNYK